MLCWVRYGRRRKVELLGWIACLLLEAILTHYHKLDGLKQEQFILSQFRRLEAWQGGVPCGGARGESILASSSFWWLPQHSCFCGLLTPASASHHTCPSPLCVLMLSPLASLLYGHV